MEVKRFDSSNENVCKYVFDFGDAIAEAVLYKYGSFDKRTVICCSVQSGCPVGCKFCGTGKKFIRNLTSLEIVSQITYCLKDMNLENINSRSEKFQIMFMSMGEPMLNYDEVNEAIKLLNLKMPNAQLLLSTIGVNNDSVFNEIINTSLRIDKVGLQFSIHESCDELRNNLIPYKNKWNLCKIRDAGIVWWNKTNRKVYLNYCINGENNTLEDFKNLKELFSPVVFNFTFSVICSPNETMRDVEFRNLETIQEFTNMFLKEGYNVRIFDPAGQDDIGGGCGQLWYVQEWMKGRK